MLLGVGGVVNSITVVYPTLLSMLLGVGGAVNYTICM